MQGIEYVSHCHSYLLEHGDVAEAHATVLNWTRTLLSDHVAKG